MWGRSVIFVRTTIGLLAAAALAVAFVGQTAAAAVTAAPRVMAHKGLHYPYSPAPENSVGAILKAAARHVPIEIDILLSKPTTAHPNGVPFVFHDTTLDRMTKLRGYVWDHTPDQLAHACLVTVPGRNTCSKYTIPRLTTVLARARAAGGTLDIEIKNETLTWTQAATIVQRLEWTDAWTWDTMPGFQDPMILSAWAQPLGKSGRLLLTETIRRSLPSS
jgi:glycerophosphoryl diester phosphodiesterase